jgi:SH3-like domain-containing protein
MKHLFFTFGLAMILAAALSSGPSYSQDTGTATGLPLPRYASLKSDNVYVRAGPSMDYPIRWVYKRDGLPVEIQQEFDAWRKVKMPDGEIGWVHKILIAGVRYAQITDKKGVVLYSDDDMAKPLARLENGVIVKVDECLKLQCHVAILPYEGWIEKKALWGVYGSEIFN